MQKPQNLVENDPELLISSSRASEIEISDESRDPRISRERDK